MKTLHVTYTLDETLAWNVTIEELPGCFTFGRSIGQARGRVRDAVWAHTGDKKFAKSVAIEETLAVPAGLQLLRERERTHRALLEEAEREATKARLELVKAMLRKKLSTRDAGELLGLSQQRVHQLAALVE